MSNKKIQVKLPNVDHRQYDIVIGDNVVRSLISIIKKQSVYNVVVITDTNVKKLYGDKLLSDLKIQLTTYNLQLIAFSAGEKSKTQQTVTKLQNEMFKLKCGRDTLVVALGGGVVGDTAGYVAATYMRGVPFIQVPTTLLSMVDSSVGGKVGIDNKYGKNLIGAFHQPLGVFVNINYLSTLSKQHLLGGLCETIKIFITHDREMFDYVVKNYEEILNLDKSVLEKIISRAVEIKASVVVRDEKEKGERSVLNFGHTIGHAIEKLSNYKLLHGEAVGLGVLVEAKIAQLVGKLPESVFEELESFVVKLIKTERLKDYKIENILQEIKLDKKSKGGQAKFVLLKGVGRFCKQHGRYAHSVDDKIIRKALRYFI